MDKYFSVYSVITFLVMISMDIVCGFPVKRSKDVTKHGDVNVTCITKVIFTNDSQNDLTNPIIPKDNVSTILDGVLYRSESVRNSRNESELAISDDKKDNINPRQKELPMAMIIAGPAAAVGIALFLCILYAWHTKQLDSKARELSISLYVSPDDSSDSNDSNRPSTTPNPPRSPRATLPPPVPSSLPPHAQRRKSTLSVPSIGIPGTMHKRGSSWSALADQEIINLSAPRRHSTFIL